METKHTPGPWSSTRTSAAGHDVISSEVAPVDICVVSKAGKSKAEIDANARLIAAAPDLLEALESLEREGWFRYIVNAVKKETDRTDLYDAVTQARAAIAKATGA